MKISDALAANGYIDLGVFHPEKCALEVAYLMAEELRVRVDGDVESLTVNSTETKPKNTYAGNYGLGTLPLHTDLAHWHIPPRYFMLRCAVADPQVFTVLLHHREVVEKLPRHLVERALFRPRRRLDGKMFFLRVHAGGIFRWDQLFLTPENSEAEQVYNVLTSAHPLFEPVHIALDTPGRTLIIDNWNVLHARTAVGTSTSPRRIERVYFSEE